METSVDRIRGLMEKANLNKSQLARALGMSRQSVAYWFDGRNHPSDKAIAEIARVFKVNPYWLRTGSSDYDFNFADVKTREEAGEDNYVRIPEVRLSFGCGEGREAPSWVEPEDGSYATYPQSFFVRHRVNPKKCRRAIAEGDSMEPLIRDGDHVLFVELDQGEPVRDGAVYCLSYGNGLKIKQLRANKDGSLVMHSANPEYADEVFSPDEVERNVRIYGRVIERSGDI